MGDRSQDWCLRGALRRRRQRVKCYCAYADRIARTFNLFRAVERWFSVAKKYRAVADPPPRGQGRRREKRTARIKRCSVSGANAPILGRGFPWLVRRTSLVSHRLRGPSCETVADQQGEDEQLVLPKCRALFRSRESTRFRSG
jgi:hypothetical protein